MSGAITPVLVLAQADPQQVRDTVEEVLMRPEYVDAGVGERGLILEGLAWLLERLGRLLLESGFFDFLDGAPTPGETGRGAVVIVGLMLLIVGGAVLLVRWRRRQRRVQATDLPVGRPGDVWADEAHAHEQAGEYRQALRCRYAETLARLSAAGLVVEVRGATTGEYLAEVARRLPAAQEPFAALTRQFEDAWYGGRSVDLSDLQRAVGHRTAVLGHAGLRGARVRVSA